MSRNLLPGPIQSVHSFHKGGCARVAQRPGAGPGELPGSGSQDRSEQLTMEMPFKLSQLLSAEHPLS